MLRGEIGRHLVPDAILSRQASLCTDREGVRALMGLRGIVSRLVAADPRRMRRVYGLYSRVLGHNKIRVSGGNTIRVEGALLRNTSIAIRGTGNSLVIKGPSRLTECSIFVNGDNNDVLVSERTRLRMAELHVEDDGNQILVGEGTTIDGQAHLAAIEGTSITIGSDCMISSGVHIATGDSHSILDECGTRINPSKSIVIGSHVWVGTRAVILKGGDVADHSVVGAGALVTQSFGEPHVILAGNPARVIRSGIDWSRERIPQALSEPR